MLGVQSLLCRVTAKGRSRVVVDSRVQELVAIGCWRIFGESCALHVCYAMPERERVHAHQHGALRMCTPFDFRLCFVVRQSPAPAWFVIMCLVGRQSPAPAISCFMLCPAGGKVGIVHVVLCAEQRLNVRVL